MGRKIPGKKHRGVKDPEKQKKEREDKVKKQVRERFQFFLDFDKTCAFVLMHFSRPQVNAGPAVIDDQEVPKKLLRLMKEKETWKEVEARRREMKALKKKSKEEGDSDLLDSSKSAM